MSMWRPYKVGPPFRGNERHWIRAAAIVFALTLLLIVVAGSLDWLLPPDFKRGR
ncbi:MAG TPA: hypothetical protein VGU45_16600 [Microvirga sp.]|jgi:hypothetical protein|nr:hypothetical protein [Microvirga sp.]